MKIFTVITLAACLVIGMPGCQLAKKYPAATRAIMSIGINAAVYKISMNNPGIRPYLTVVGGMLMQPVENIHPSAVSERIKTIIKINVDDPVYRELLLEVEAMITEFYTQVYIKHQNEISQSDYIEMIKAFGAAIKSGTRLRHPQQLELFLVTDRAIIEIK